MKLIFAAFAVVVVVAVAVLAEWPSLQFGEQRTALVLACLPILSLVALRRETTKAELRRLQAGQMSVFAVVGAVLFLWGLYWSDRFGYRGIAGRLFTYAVPPVGGVIVWKWFGEGGANRVSSSEPGN